MTVPWDPDEPYVPPPPTAPPPGNPAGLPPYPYAAPAGPYPYAATPAGPYPYAATPPGPYGYPAAPYPGAAYPVAYGPPPRPSPATGSAILGFIVAGIVILLGALLLLGASVASSIDRAHGVGVEIGFDGALNLLMGGLLIGGGVGLPGGRRSGRTMLACGNAIVIAASIYWLFRFGSPHGGSIFPLIIGAMAVISISLAAGGNVTRWLTPPR